MKRMIRCKLKAKDRQAKRKRRVRAAGWHRWSEMKGIAAFDPDIVLTIDHVRRAIEVLKANNVPPDKDGNYTLYAHDDVGVKGWDY